MKIAVISDIHGNYPALKAVLDDVDRRNIKQVLCLGDICGYYCMVNQCIDEIRDRNIISLMGNHDYYLLNHVTCSSKTVKICIDYQKEIITEQNRKWISGLPQEYDTKKASFRHGGWRDPIEERIEDFDFDIVNEHAKQYYFSGHTHIQQIQKEQDVTYCNPGAIGQPRDHDPRAAYAIFVPDGEIELKRVPYDIDRIVYEMKKSGQGDWIANVLYSGKRIGE